MGRIAGGSQRRTPAVDSARRSAASPHLADPLAVLPAGGAGLPRPRLLPGFSVRTRLHRPL